MSGSTMGPAKKALKEKALLMPIPNSLANSPHVPLQKVSINHPALALVEEMFDGRAEDLFDIVNPLGDGNCGFYVVQMFNEHTRREETMTHTQFRIQLAHWIHKNEHEILTQNDHAIGRDELRRLREVVYQPNLIYERGCNSSMWCKLDHFAIVAQMQKCNVVTFIAGNKGPCFIQWDGANVVKTKNYHVASKAVLPHPTCKDGQKNTIYCIFHNANHFIWLRPKPVLAL
jgi:hypothetical protein